jgi:butyryl-CoA dehydrogenase
MILTEEQQLIRESARAFAQNELWPNAAAWDRDSHVPVDKYKAMGELGLMGIIVPEEWGGAGADYVSFALAMIEIAAGDGGCGTLASVMGLLSNALYRFGSEAQKTKYLSSLASGKTISAFALTEPQAGSDASNLRVRAEERDDHFILNGTKQFITAGSIADFAIVFAVTDPELGKKGITAFLVDADTPGYRVASIENKLGQHSSDTCQLVFENLKVPTENMLGARGEGYKIALANLEGGRVGIAAQSVGMARAAMEVAIEYAKERESFGKPIIEHQGVAFRLADMATQVEAGTQMVLHAAALKDSGASCLKEASMAKLFASEMAEKVCSGAIQTLGGYGYLSDFPVERIYRDVRVCQIYEGTSDIQRLVIGRALAAE